MSKRTYIVTYIAADGQTKTDGIVGRNHAAVEKFIERQGGQVLHLDRDEDMLSKAHAFRHDILGIVLFVVAALAVIAFAWYRMR